MSATQMHIQLDEVEGRVLGSLIEKDMATPDYYPMSLNALVNACNQKTNREPIMALDAAMVESALESLRRKKLALMITGADHRVPKHAHRISETLNLGNRELALLCVLLLRGPQTVGELRGRTHALYNFDDLDAVESALQRLMDFQPEPLVKKLERQAGFKEPRYAHLLSGDVEVVEEPVRPLDPVQERISKLEAQVESLSEEVRGLERKLAEFRKQFD